jgi:hypothetical protein
MPKTKTSFRKYLKTLPPDQLIAPGDIHSCFFCGFVQEQLKPEQSRVQFFWDSYIVGRSSNERPLPDWAAKFTHDASNYVAAHILSPSGRGSRITSVVALEILSKC